MYEYNPETRRVRLLEPYRHARRVQVTQAELRRDAICALVNREPGICYRAIVRASGLSMGTVAHHLRMLKKQGLVTESALGQRRTFYPQGSRVPGAADATLAREPALQQLLDIVALRESTSQGAVLDALQAAGWPRSTTQHRLSRLVALGKVSERRSGRFLLYEVQRIPVFAMAPELEVAA